jgi:basic membrane lipoprotein Med (substrate-binding protein (PBP1-ABC) superfamily)
MREYAEQGTQLIVGEIFGVEQEAREVATEYPNVAFLMGSSFMHDAAANPNLAVFDNYIQDAAYLTGIIAGSMTQTGNVGMVGGFPIPEVNRLMHAFMAGVREMRADATFQVSFIGSWFDPPKAKETAFAMIEAGADMMYAERFGVSDAAQERGVLAIGNVIDTQPDYPNTVVVSALWHFEPTMNAAIANVKAGTFVADNYGVYSYMKNGGCSISPLGTFEGKVPEAAMALVAERQAAILDGSFTVPIDDSEPTSSS